MSSIEQSPPLRVLLVEDYADLAEVTAEFLRAEGLYVRIAMSGREASFRVFEIGWPWLKTSK